MRYVIIYNNTVTNIVQWDGNTAWTPPARHSVVQSDVLCNIGWNWNDGVPIDPNPPPPPIVIPPIDLSNLDNLDQVLRAIGLMTGRWAGKTPAQIKSDFLTAYKDIRS